MLKNFEGNNYTDITKSEGLVLVDFFATWCQPCKILMPTVEELANERKDVEFYKLDVDKNREVAVGEKVSSIPTLVLYKDGVRVDSVTGVKTKQQLIDWIEEHK